jgi:hypothetical protein
MSSASIVELEFYKASNRYFGALDKLNSFKGNEVGDEYYKVAEEVYVAGARFFKLLNVVLRRRYDA